MDKRDQTIPDLLVIGAGASGMTAAIAFQNKLLSEGKPLGRVVILEKNERVGKKVLTTGNGRCNLSNKDMSLSHFHSHSSDFPGKVLSLVTPLDCLAFLEEIGIVTAAEGDKLFPMSKTASSVVDCFRYRMDELKIETVENAVVTEIVSDGTLKVVCEDQREFSARKIIIATGGACAAYTGSSGDGYRWLHDFGHKVYAPKPSIVQLLTENSVTKALSGLRLDADVSLICDGHVIASQYGEVLFTDYGLSGPAVFQVSGEVSRRMKKDRLPVPMKVSLRLFDEETLSCIRGELELRRESFSSRTIDQLLLSILPQKIGVMLVKSALERPMGLPVSALSDADINRILNTMRSWNFQVLGTRSLEYAQTTIGGADCDEFSSDTLESSKVEGLFACGEVLDVDGDCGGYNLTWAFSSGILAGRSAAEQILSESEA